MAARSRKAKAPFEVMRSSRTPGPPVTGPPPLVEPAPELEPELEPAQAPTDSPLDEGEPEPAPDDDGHADAVEGAYASDTRPDAGSDAGAGAASWQAEPSPSRVDGGGYGAGSSAGGENWRSPQAIVLRIPQGYAYIGAVAVLGVIVLAYGVGHQQGLRAGEQRHRDLIAQQEADRLREAERAAGLVTDDDLAAPVRSGVSPGGRQSAGAGAGGERPTASRFVAPRDTREAGRNYYVIAYYNEEEARRLVAFLLTHGVEALVVPANNNAFHVIALRGFARGEINSAQAQAYESELRRLGRLWRSQGGSDDLSSMWLKRHSD